jgi:hypothetical protein
MDIFKGIHDFQDREGDLTIPFYDLSSKYDGY